MQRIFTVFVLLVLIAMPLFALGAGSIVSGSDADVRALSPQPEPPDLPAAVSDRVSIFTLIRIAPFSGTNPFDFQRLRHDVVSARSVTGDGSGSGGSGSANTCTPGVLLLTTTMPVVPPAEAYIDINPISNTLSIRESGAVGADTALIVSIPVIDFTRFSPGSGWQAISPALPQDYQAGAPPQTFVLQRTNSGDFYRLTISFIGTSTLVINSAGGDCCGQGGCP